MALENFIRTIWEASILENLKKAHVFANVANRNYEGELKNLGDRVKVLQISDVTVTAYTKSTDISLQELDDAATEIIADQANYFAFSTQDVEAVQSKATVLSSATQNAAYGLRNGVDTHFAGLVNAGAGMHSYATGTTPWDMTSLNLDTIMTSVTRQLDEGNVPEQGRFIIVPAWVREKLTLLGLATVTDNKEIFTNGLISRAFGFNWYMSNNVSQASATTGDHAKILVGIEGQSLSYADVIASVEAYRPEKRFEDAVKGLHVFGGKIMRPDMTLCLHADWTAES